MLLPWLCRRFSCTLFIAHACTASAHILPTVSGLTILVAILVQVLKLGSQAGYDVEAGRVPGLQGTVPPELGNLPQLRQLSLELNSLTGTLPASLCPEGGERLHCCRRWTLCQAVVGGSNTCNKWPAGLRLRSEKKHIPVF